MQPAFTFEQFLRDLPRRYRLAELTDLDDALNPPLPESNHHAARLATVLEQARRTLTAGIPPGHDLEQAFVRAMAGMIQEAAEKDSGDPVFQAMALEWESPTVSEYTAALSYFQQDKRQVQTLADAIAHPGKLVQQPLGPLRDALKRLHRAVTAQHWADVHHNAQQALTLPEVGHSDTLGDTLKQLHDAPALARLTRLEALEEQTSVQRYQTLRAQQGPLANSRAAARQGAEGRRRGMSVETLTAQALRAIADKLNASSAGADAPYRVITSMYVPASLAAGRSSAKTEWDVVLLKQMADARPGAATYDIALLIEAKASPDAVGTDFPRLLRGLRLLAEAKPDQCYVFRAREGEFTLRGASLSTLPTELADLATTVLYCSNAPADPNPRLLSAASRMKLLSAPESLAFAAALTNEQRPDTRLLQTLWQQVLTAPEWKLVLNQTLALRQARELMVHTDDFLVVE